MKHSDDSNKNLMRTEKEFSPESPVDLEDASLFTTRIGCGFGRCRPRFLQYLANPIIFMIVLNFYCLVEGAIVSGEPG